MGIVGAVVIARWSWSLMRDTAAVLLDRTNERMDKAIRYRVGKFGDVCLTDLHVWRVGPEAYASIVEVEGAIDSAALRRELIHIRGIAHLTIGVHESRQKIGRASCRERVCQYV